MTRVPVGKVMAGDRVREIGWQRFHKVLDVARRGRFVKLTLANATEYTYAPDYEVERLDEGEQP
jgi:hypothetical protein